MIVIAQFLPLVLAETLAGLEKSLRVSTRIFQHNADLLYRNVEPSGLTACSSRRVG